MKNLLQLVLIIFVSTSSSAQNISLDGIAKQFIETSPVLAMLKEQINAAENLEIEAGRNLFPSISLTGSATDQQVSLALYNGFDFMPDKIYSTALTFNQPLYMGGRIQEAWNMRKKNVDLAKLNYLEQEQQLLLIILNKSLNLHTLIQIKNILIESQRVQKKFLDVVRARASRGAAKEHELAQAEANFLSYQTQLDESDLRINQLLNDLASETQISIDSLKSLKIPEPQQNVSLDSDKLNMRPDLLLADKKIEMAEIQKALDMGEHYPSVHLQGAWGFESIETGDLFDDLAKKHTISLGINIPIFSGFTSTYVKRASENNIVAAKLNKKNKLQEAQTELNNAKYKLSLSFLIYQNNKKWNLFAQKAVNSGFKSFQLGVLPTFQLVQLQRESEMAAIAFWNSLQSFYVEKYNGLKASGLSIRQSL